MIMSFQKHPLLIHLLLLLIFTNISSFAAAQQYGCFGRNNTSNSTFTANLNSLLPSLPPNISNSGFYNASSSPNTDAAFASALCRVDSQLDTCRACVRNATSELQTLCSNRRQGVLFKPLCTVRYSDESMYGVLSNAYLIRGRSTNVSNSDQFRQTVQSLLGELSAEAASGGAMMKVAAGNRSFSSSETVFAILQCSPDLSSRDCSNCLAGMVQRIPQCCNGSILVIMFVPSCNLQFQIEPFYNVTRIEQVRALLSVSSPPAPAPSLVPTTPSSPPGKGDESGSRTIIFIVIPMVLCVVVGGFGICIWLRKRMKKKKKKKPQEITENEEMEISSEESLVYEFAKIKAATNDFSDSNKLGEGGFGVVYKGKLENGREIAVKRLSKNSGQGDEEFKNEVLSMAKLEHRNLVRLLGFCVQGKERLLIYEFLQNGSLHSFIFDPIKRVLIDWDQRYKIIREIAKGLVYLHDNSGFRIIHRDLKAGNILLDKDMNPKIADFGMARLFSHDQSGTNTNRIVGTFGYMAPEYARHGQISVKLDVFSFGVLVLEIVSGQKNGSFRSSDNDEFMLSFAWRNWREGKGKKMIDPVLMSGSSSVREMLRCIHIGLLCVQENAADRPTMSTLVVMLSSLSVTLPLPSKPAFFMRNALGVGVDPINSSSRSREKIDESSTNDDASVTDLYPR